MRMQNLDMELYSLPVKIFLAGFESTTLQLAKNGWEFSMRQGLSPYRGDYELQLVIRHSGTGLAGMSAPMRLERTWSDAGNMLRLLETGFHMQYLNSDVKYRMETSQIHSFVSSFEAVDVFPQERELGEVSIHEFKFFKVASPNLKDIIVCPELVPELLDMVLKAQSPKMKEIQARERSRANTQWARENIGSVKPAHQVQAQLITLAS